MSDYSKLIEIFEKLIAFRTVSGNATAAAECLAYIQSVLAPLGLHIDRYSSNGFESLVATTRPTRSPRLFLVAHLDVVPAEDELFILQRTEQKLIGRGVFDMKYAAACYLQLVKAIRDNLEDYDFGLMFTFDEELGGANGVKYLLGQGYGSDISLIPDGGDDWRLETVAKGAYWMAVEATGVSAHASRPWEGDNALDKLLGFLAELKNLTKSKEHADPTIAVTSITGGSAMNQIPDSASALVDIRYSTPEQLDSIIQQIKKLSGKYGIDCTEYETATAINLDVNLPLVQQWSLIVAEVRGQPDCEYAMSFGATDARFFAEKGIPAIVTRPVGGGMHGDQEWIDETSFYQFYECLSRYVDVVARMPLDGSAPTGYTDGKLPETVTGF